MAGKLLNVQAPNGGTTFPPDVAKRLWTMYSRAIDSGGGGKLGTSPPGGGVVHPDVVALFNGTSEARRSVDQLAFLLTLAELGVDLRSVAAETEATRAALAALPSLDVADLTRNSTRELRKAFGRMAELRARVTPLYERWFQCLLATSNGPKQLIDMRSDIMSIQETLARGSGSVAAAKQAAELLRPVEESLTSVLREWCSQTWLVVAEMSWLKTPAMVVEQICRHEAVHRFDGLADVKRRMHPSPDRCAFAFFHPGFVAEPLTMVVVALTHGIADNVDGILRSGGQHRLLNFAGVPHSHPLTAPFGGKVVVQNSTSASDGSSGSCDAARPDVARDTAIFYSITSTQDGLKGIELGGHLIKGAVKQLRAAHPHLTQFSTLSPIPAYGGWLRRRIAELSKPAEPASPTDLLLSAQVARIFGVDGKTSFDAEACVTALSAKYSTTGLLPRGQASSALEIAKAISDVLEGRGLDKFSAETTPRWYDDARLSDLLQPLLLPSVHGYLANVKRRGRAFDPVANFHLRNGALLYRVNWLGNRTDKASAASACVMVNYLYDLDRIDQQAAAYASSGDIVNTSYTNVVPRAEH